MLTAATATIREMQERNKALEDHIVELRQAILDVLHGDKSVARPEHVLHAELMELKKKNQVSACIDKSDMQSQLVDSLGTLKISADGNHTTFLGSTASSEFLMGDTHIKDFKAARIRCIREEMPAELLVLGRIFVFSQSPETASMNARSALRTAAPPREIAYSLCENYFLFGTWLIAPVCRQEFFDGIFEPLYASETWRDITFDRISLLFMVLSVGTLLDFKLEVTEAWKHAYRFHKIGGGALGMSEFMETPSITSCQAIGMTCAFHLFSDDPDGPARSWATTGLLLRMAQSTGLHRKNPIFDQRPKERQRRSRLWWEIVCLDRIQSLFYGRPTSIDNRQSDTPFPEETDEEIKHKVFKYRFIDSCILPVITEALAVKPPSYATILKLDKDIRDFEMPEPITPSPESQNPDMLLALQQYALHGYKEMTILHLHRSAFLTALREHPNDPLKHRFAPSVLAVHKAACIVIHNTYVLLQQYSLIVPRVYIWVLHAFSATVLLAALVTRSPGSSLSASSLMKLDFACSCFEQCRSNVRMSTALPIVLKFRNLAQRAFASFKSGKNSLPSEQEQEQLSILSGTNHIVFSQPRSQESSPSAGTAESGSPETPELHETLQDHFKSVEREQQRYDPLNPVPELELPPAPVPPEGANIDDATLLEYFRSLSSGALEQFAPIEEVPGQLRMPIDGVNYNFNMLQEQQSNDPFEFLSKVPDYNPNMQSWDYAA
ncbi:hypothetical protein FRC20_009718 [Serendipita sp. 405]|nr:hypothetical protein FRC20_009718 [Serendipita sp. 405]